MVKRRKTGRGIGRRQQKRKKNKKVQVSVIPPAFSSGRTQLGGFLVSPKIRVRRKKRGKRRRN